MPANPAERCTKGHFTAHGLHGREYLPTYPPTPTQAQAQAQAQAHYTLRLELAPSTGIPQSLASTVRNSI